MKSALRDLPICIIRHEKHYVDQPPPVAFPPLVPYGTKGGRMHFPRPQVDCMVFAAKGGIKNGAEGAVPRQRSDTI